MEEIEWWNLRNNEIKNLVNESKYYRSLGIIKRNTFRIKTDEVGSYIVKATLEN